MTADSFPKSPDPAAKCEWTPERRERVREALSGANKAFGHGLMVRLGKNDAILGVDVISTGSPAIDLALGIGGLPRGRITEIYGLESSGKTTLALQVIAEAQRAGGTAAFIDAEHALDPDYAAKLGVDIDRLIVSRPDSGEQALEIAYSLLQSRCIDTLVVDSVAALVPEAELGGTMGENHAGAHARLMSQNLRKIAGITARSNACLIFINQLRTRIGTVVGNPEATTGGLSLRFYASVRAEIRRGDAVKEGRSIIGNRTRLRILKNKCAGPFREVEFDILFNEGISKIHDLLDMGVAHGVIQKAGAWFVYGGQRIGEGRHNARQFLKEHPVALEKIEADVRESSGLARITRRLAEVKVRHFEALASR